MFTCVLGCYAASTVVLVYTFRRCADSVGGQLRRGNKECPAFSDVISSGSVWRKVPESDARSVAGQVSSETGLPLSQFCHFQIPAVSTEHWRNAVTTRYNAHKRSF